MFNHESRRRGETFVTRKITRAVARTAVHPRPIWHYAVRDWGTRPEYVEGMYGCQTDEPDTCFATGRGFHSAWSRGLRLSMPAWTRQYVKFDQRYLRPPRWIR